MRSGIVEALCSVFEPGSVLRNELLEESLEEEKSANDALTSLAENQSNVMAETED